MTQHRSLAPHRIEGDAPQRTKLSQRLIDFAEPLFEQLVAELLAIATGRGAEVVVRAIADRRQRRHARHAELV